MEGQTRMLNASRHLAGISGNNMNGLDHPSIWLLGSSCGASCRVYTIVPRLIYQGLSGIPLIPRLQQLLQALSEN